MKFLVDENLPPMLAKWLGRSGYSATHAVDLDERRLDIDLWAYAEINGLIVISKDVDFAYLAQARTGGPQVVWVRCGNLTLRVFEPWFMARFPEIEQRLLAGNRLIEVR